MRDSCAPLGVVGQEQKTFARFIEPADRSDPLSTLRQQRVDRRASLLVVGGGHQPARFVEDQISSLGGGGLLSVDFDEVQTEAHRRLRVARRFAVQPYSAFSNQQKSPGAGAVAELRQ